MKKPRLPFPRRCRFVRAETIAAALDRRHLSHTDLAGLLGISRSYWSQLYRGRRRLSPKMRLALLACPALEGLGEADLWDTVEIPPKEAA
ncbi:MAG: helix-turn-helix transcriptional regulator [Pseudomonadota bacterium]